jgi:hypothetical protein
MGYRGQTHQQSTKTAEEEFGEMEHLRDVPSIKSLSMSGVTTSERRKLCLTFVTTSPITLAQMPSRMIDRDDRELPHPWSMGDG